MSHRGLHRSVLFVLALASTCCLATPPKVGDLPPEGRIARDREGNAVQVSDYAGKVVVLSFWASWCGPCRKELPMLESLQVAAEKKQLGLQVIAVNIDERDAFRRVAAKLGPLHLRLANTEPAHAERMYGVKAIPHMVMIGRDGRLAQIHIGYGENEIDHLLEEINALLGAQSAPAAPAASPAQS